MPPKAPSSLRIRSSLAPEQQAAAKAAFWERMTREASARDAPQEAVAELRAIGGARAAYELRRLADEEFRRVERPEFAATAVAMEALEIATERGDVDGVRAIEAACQAVLNRASIPAKICSDEESGHHEWAKPPTKLDRVVAHRLYAKP